MDALKIAMESKSRVNMVMLGAVVKAAGFIPLELAYDLVRDTLQKVSRTSGTEFGGRETWIRGG